MPDKKDPMRQAFEAWISGPPYERDIKRWPDDERKYSWPGQYCEITTQVAWEAWQEASVEMSTELPKTLDALRSLWGFLEDVGKSNPGWMSKLCLQDYGAMNDAYIKTERVLAQFSGPNITITDPHTQSK